jgi:hypothetical protein
MGPDVSALNTYRVGVGDEGFADVGDLGTARDGHAKKEGGGKRHNESGHCCILKSVVDDSDATDWKRGWAAEKGTPPSRSREWTKRTLKWASRKGRR